MEDLVEINLNLSAGIPWLVKKKNGLFETHEDGWRTLPKE